MSEKYLRYKMICKDCEHYIGNGEYCIMGRLVYDFDYCYLFDELKLGDSYETN